MTKNRVQNKAQTSWILYKLCITWCKVLGPVFQRQMDDLIDELPVEKRHLSKLIIICRI